VSRNPKSRRSCGRFTNGETMRDIELLHNLTIADIEPWFDSKVLAKARQLYYAGQVLERGREETVLIAEVQGDDGFYYDVAVAVTDGWVQAACDCARGGYCEHIGAVLLNWIHAPQDFDLESYTFSADFMDYVQELVADLESKELEEPIEYDERERISAKTPSDLDAVKTLALQAAQTAEKELRELLWEQTVQQLRAIARRRGWKLHGTRKEELVNQLVELYQDGQDTAAAVENLDDIHRLTLEFLALRASATPVSETVANKTIRELNRRNSNKEATGIVEALKELGLVFAMRGHTYRMPAVVLHQLPPWPNLLAPFKDDLAKADVHKTSAFALTEVAYQTWQYLRESPTPLKARRLPRPTRMERQWPTLSGWLNPPDEVAELERSGSRFWYNPWQQSISVQFLPPGLSDADLTQLRQRTAVANDILDFAFSLLTSLGFVQWKYGSDIQIDEGRMMAFLTHSDTERQRMLTTAWLNQDQWTEMSLVLQHWKHLKLQRNLGQFDLTYRDLIQELAQARLIVVRLLSRLSPDTWYGVADLRQLLRRFWPDYLHAGTRSSTQRWWLATAEGDYHLSPDKAADWEAGYAPFVTACLEGPLAWIGAVTLGYDRKGLAAFQITDLGAFLLGLRRSYSDTIDKPKGPALAVHGDGSVIARTGYAATGAYDLLSIAAELGTTSAHQFEYQITAATAQRAFDQGWTGPAILDELERYSDGPVPEPLRSHILAWAEGYGQVHLYDEVTLVEFSDDFALQELLASTSLAQHLVYQFSDRLAAIKAESIEVLRDELIQLGHTPRIE